MKPPSATCHNCGGNDFYSQKAHFHGHAAMLIRVGCFDHAEALVRVCGDCGLTEWFVTPDSVEKVKKKFAKGSTGPAPLPPPPRQAW